MLLASLPCDILRVPRRTPAADRRRVRRQNCQRFLSCFFRQILSWHTKRAPLREFASRTSCLPPTNANRSAAFFPRRPRHAPDNASRNESDSLRAPAGPLSPHLQTTVAPAQRFAEGQEPTSRHPCGAGWPSVAAGNRSGSPAPQTANDLGSATAITWVTRASM